MSLNQIIDINPAGPLVVDETLNLKAHQLRAHGDISAATFNGSPLNPIAYSTTVVPFTVVGYDGSEHAVTGIDTTGSMTFFKIGKMVFVTVPAFQVSTFVTGGAAQLLRIKFNSALPASLVPFDLHEVCVAVENGGTASATPGAASLAGSDHITVTSNAAAATFTVNCGVERPSVLAYYTA